MNIPLHSDAIGPDALVRNTLGRTFDNLVRILRASAVATPELDARLLVCHACALTQKQFAAMPERAISNAELSEIMRAVKRRCAREPVSRIVGFREFWGLEFQIGPQTLDPRPDTETLVQAVLELAGEDGRDRPHSILDLGAGSGCILVSLLHELGAATGVGTDRSMEALAYARANAERHGLGGRARFVQASWGEGLKGAFDFVVANPPYIASGEISSLQPDVAAFDPRAALDGGEDGLDAYREIIPSLQGLLAPGGWAVFEVGAKQADRVDALLRENGRADLFGGTRQWADLAGRMRCIATRCSPTS